VQKAAEGFEKHFERGCGKKAWRRHSGMSDTHKAIEAVWKIRVSDSSQDARVTRRYRVASELAQGRSRCGL